MASEQNQPGFHGYTGIFDDLLKDKGGAAAATAGKTGVNTGGVSIMQEMEEADEGYSDRMEPESSDKRAKASKGASSSTANKGENKAEGGCGCTIL